MAWQEIIGLISGALTSASLFPQVYRLFKLKSARDISYIFNFLFIIGILCWIAYGIILNLFSVILWNSITLISAFAMLYAKIKWGRV
jgi:MtN3 and saliva related transmembrane protein